MKKFFLVTLIFLLTFTIIITGCKVKNVVVKGKGVEITKEEIDKRIKEIEKSQQLDKVPKELAEQIRKNIKDQAIESLVREKLLFSGAKNEGIVITNKDIKERLDQYKKMFSTEEEFEELLKAQGQTETSLKEVIKNQLLIEKLKEKLSRGKIKITEADIKKYYEENKEEFVVPDQVRARHIVVDKLEKAKEILAELKKGISFESLVQKHTVDNLTKSRGGELGWFSREMIFANTPQFDEAVFKLKINGISEPLKTDLGYHIVQVLEKKAKEQKSFEESKQIIQNMLVDQKAQEILEAWLEKLVKEANISYKEEQTKSEPEKK